MCIDNRFTATIHFYLLDGFGVKLLFRQLFYEKIESFLSWAIDKEPRG